MTKHARKHPVVLTMIFVVMTWIVLTISGHSYQCTAVQRTSGWLSSIVAILPHQTNYKDYEIGLLMLSENLDISGKAKNKEDILINRVNLHFINLLTE